MFGQRHCYHIVNLQPIFIITFLGRNSHHLLGFDAQGNAAKASGQGCTETLQPPVMSYFGCIIFDEGKGLRTLPPPKKKHFNEQILFWKRFSNSLLSPHVFTHHSASGLRRALRWTRTAPNAPTANASSPPPASCSTPPSAPGGTSGATAGGVGVVSEGLCLPLHLPQIMSVGRFYHCWVCIFREYSNLCFFVLNICF